MSQFDRYFPSGPLDFLNRIAQFTDESKLSDFSLIFKTFSIIKHLKRSIFFYVNRYSKRKSKQWNARFWHQLVFIVSLARPWGPDWDKCWSGDLRHKMQTMKSSSKIVFTARAWQLSWWSRSRNLLEAEYGFLRRPSVSLPAHAAAPELADAGDKCQDTGLALWKPSAIEDGQLPLLVPMSDSSWRMVVQIGLPSWLSVIVDLAYSVVLGVQKESYHHRWCRRRLRRSYRFRTGCSRLTWIGRLSVLEDAWSSNPKPHV